MCSSMTISFLTCVGLPRLMHILTLFQTLLYFTCGDLCRSWRSRMRVFFLKTWVRFCSNYWCCWTCCWTCRWNRFRSCFEISSRFQRILKASLGQVEERHASQFLNRISLLVTFAIWICSIPLAFFVYCRIVTVHLGGRGRSSMFCVGGEVVRNLPAGVVVFFPRKIGGKSRVSEHGY